MAFQEEQLKARIFAQPRLHPTLGYCQDGGVLRLVETGTSTIVYPDVAEDPPAVWVLGVPCYRCERCGKISFDLVLLAAAERAVKVRLEQGEVLRAEGIPFQELGVLMAPH
jgi:hypothetical protein